VKWITGERVKVYRVACPWLIRRFIDPDAEFAFLPRDTDWCAIADGTVFDVPGCELGHHSESVNFDAVLNRYQINEPALRLLAEIVRAADSSPSLPHAAGEGLRWIAHGFSTLGFTDHELLDCEFPIYDALYAECQGRTRQA
jgi:hypothetical protein